MLSVAIFTQYAVLIHGKKKKKLHRGNITFAISASVSSP